MHMLKEKAKMSEVDASSDARGRLRSIENIEGLAEAIYDLTDNLARLEAEVEVLKSNADDTSVKFGGLGLRSLQECQAWMAGHFNSYRYGLVMDPLLMLERVFGADTETSQWKTLESRKKLEIPMGGEAAALSALAFPRPRQFHDGKVAMTIEKDVSCLTKFLTTNSSNESMTALEATVKEMKADVKEALAKSKAAVSKADVATGKADTAKAALESMIKKLDKK